MCENSSESLCEREKQKTVVSLWTKQFNSRENNDQGGDRIQNIHNLVYEHVPISMDNYHNTYVIVIVRGQRFMAVNQSESEGIWAMLWVTVLQKFS